MKQELIDSISVMTPQLKQMIAHYQDKIPQDQFENLIRDIKTTFDKYVANLRAYPAGPSRAMALHRLISVPIQQNQTKPTCAKGCGACCHLEVEITRDEGELLALVVSEGHAIDRQRLLTQASRERKSLDWNTLVSLENRCVFLGDDQSCQVYEFRPSICRKHVVVSDPSECMSPTGSPQPILIPMAEIALSAALSLPGNTYASLSKSLYSALVRHETAERANPMIPNEAPVDTFSS